MLASALRRAQGQARDDEQDHVRLGGYPGAFAELLGIRVEEFNPLLPGQEIALSQGRGSVWSEFATATTAQTVLTYADAPLAGRPAITRHQAGRGEAWYVGTMLDDDTWRWLLADLVAAAGVTPAANVPVGVEAVRRRAGERSWLFLLNHTAADATVSAAGYDLVAQAEVGGEFVLPAGGCAVIREH